MPITTDILSRRATQFVLWDPFAQRAGNAPQLIIGQLQPGNPPTFVGKPQLSLNPVAGSSGLYAIDSADCGLTDGTVYHYWFEVDDSAQNPPSRIAVTDPFATCVDWRIFPPNASDQSQPASVVKYAGGNLTAADPGGETALFELPDAPDQLPTNNRLVIYELPTAWAMSRSLNQPERDVGTFLDAAALVDERIGGANFSELSILDVGQAYLPELGINALELLPPADSFFKREWGYDTSHYLAPDYELGYPEGNASPTANQDLAKLVNGCHRKGIRFFVDSVMAFAHEEPFSHIDFPDFCIDFDPFGTPPDDPDALTSGRAPYGAQQARNAFGSTLWRYSRPASTYDPVSGTTGSIFPARQLMLTALTRWMRDFRVDGWRLDSVENVANWDFVQAYHDRAHDLWLERWTNAGLAPAGAQDRFLVVGEELSLPSGLLTQNRLDGLWNDDFQARVRAAILGDGANNDNFEWTVRKCIDCRLTNIFTQGVQAINYFTSHDVEGHERLFTMLRKISDVDDFIESRIKLAFVCLMTAVGIPMFLAGEEFGDQHDLFDQNGNVSENGGKQIDPVNYGRLTAPLPDPEDPNPRADNPDGYFGPMRRRILAYVKLLIRLRTTSDALATDDNNFIWTDFNGKQVIVWQRGSAGSAAQPPVVVLANFSDFNSGLSGEYIVPTWPGPAPAGMKWVEITQQRDVIPAQVGREPIFPWEAKVYTYATA